MNKNIPWQLQMFKKTLKKKLRLKALRKHLGYLSSDDQCLLVTCGDNNGAMNYYLREIGGQWSWADYETISISEMSELLGDKVFHVKEDSLPFSDEFFDCVVSIDVHEHLMDPDRYTKELYRVTKHGGKIVITVPNGEEGRLVTKIRNSVGMTKEKYGHVREGFGLSELSDLLIRNGFRPLGESSFSRFFTEMLELSINFAYLNILGKKSGPRDEAETIAPATKDQLKSIERTYRLYSLIYPFFWLISKLDIVFWGSVGYVVMVEGKKE